MKKIKILILIALCFFCGFAFSETKKSWSVVDSLYTSGFGSYEKTYDSNTRIVCYSYQKGYAGGISCVKI